MADFKTYKRRTARAHDRAKPQVRGVVQHGLPLRPMYRWEVVDLNRHDGTPTWRDSGWRWRWQAVRRARSVAQLRRTGIRDRKTGTLCEVNL